MLTVLEDILDLMKEGMNDVSAVIGPVINEISVIISFASSEVFHALKDTMASIQSAIEPLYHAIFEPIGNFLNTPITIPWLFLPGLTYECPPTYSQFILGCKKHHKSCDDDCIFGHEVCFGCQNDGGVSYTYLVVECLANECPPSSYGHWVDIGLECIRTGTITFTVTVCVRLARIMN